MEKTVKYYKVIYFAVLKSTSSTLNVGLRTFPRDLVSKL